MVLAEQIFPLTIMVLILVFSLIHLGVGVGLVVNLRRFGDIFQPQIGLSGFNLAISVIGVITSILGLVSISMSSRRFGVIISAVAGALGIFALASLIAALILNSRAAGNASGSISNNMIVYSYDTNARNAIDALQSQYQCCGNNLWIDWSGYLNTTTFNTTNVTTPLVSTTTSLTITGNATVTTISSSSTSASSVATFPETTGTMSTTPSPTATPDAIDSSGTTSSGALSVKRDVGHIYDDFPHEQSLRSSGVSRQKRQLPSNYGGIDGLPPTFQVVLPSSCCKSEVLTGSNTSIPYCLSNMPTNSTHFYTEGCAKVVGTVGGSQLMGIGVINSFMIVLACVAIPLLIQQDPDSI